MIYTLLRLLLKFTVIAGHIPTVHYTIMNIISFSIVPPCLFKLISILSPHEYTKDRPPKLLVVYVPGTKCCHHDALKLLKQTNKVASSQQYYHLCNWEGGGARARWWLPEERFDLKLKISTIWGTRIGAAMLWPGVSKTKGCVEN